MDLSGKIDVLEKERNTNFFRHIWLSLEAKQILTLSSFADFECILKSEYKPTVYAPTLEKNEYIFFSKCLLRKESSSVVHL